MARISAFALAGSFALLAPGAALAQDAGGDRVNQVIIFGADECPVSEGDTITVCARLDESERYRIPPRLRNSSSPDNEAWAQRAQSFETIGRYGPLSCSTMGSGSDLGCTAAMIEAAYAERAAGSDVRFSQLIEQERAERLSEIDAEAAATQARVEALERAYMERLEAERDGGDAAVPAEGEAPADLATPPGN
jgi:hypothetical protein